MNLLPMILRRGLLALLPLSLPAAAGLFTDPDPDWKEGPYALPSAPNKAALREFFVSNTTRNHFYIDEGSIAVGEDGVVRYVLVVESVGGARNATVEGIRCATGTWRMYATAHPNGEWSPVRDPQWQPVQGTSYNRARAALAADHFCDGKVPPRDREEVLRRLRSSELASRYRGQ